MLKKLIVTGSILFAIIVYSCTKDKGAISGSVLTDDLLITMAKDTSGKFLYANGAGATTFTSDPAHNSRPYSLRMNKKAHDACTAGGKLPNGATFPDSSMLVKELRNSVSNLVEQYAVIYKMNGSWKWGEYKPDGSVDKKITDDSNFCTSCHTSTRDNVWTFDVHP
ncbi:MAG: cytochrome P460 family protein [Bacteroidia bacterium]